MTNGEMIQKVFKGCEVCEPIIEEDIIHVIFPDKNDSAIGFDWSWWNMEHKEPTTKNDLGVDCIVDVLGSYTDLDIPYKHEIAENILTKLTSVTPQEPQSFKWCTDCKEYDQEKHCCHRWSKVIRDTVEEMKQEQEPRWIPVSERLPEENRTVMASTTGYGLYTEARYTKEDGWEWAYESGADYWEELEDVIAWMPLPKPYKAESEEEDGNDT